MHTFQRMEDARNYYNWPPWPLHARSLKRRNRFLRCSGYSATITRSTRHGRRTAPKPTSGIKATRSLLSPSGRNNQPCAGAEPLTSQISERLADRTRKRDRWPANLHRAQSAPGGPDPGKRDRSRRAGFHGFRTIGKTGVLNSYPLLYRPEHVNVTVIYNLLPIHQNPFDRALLAQALAEDLTFLTTDRTLQQYAQERLQILS